MYFRFALYGFLKNLRFFEPFIVLIFLDKGLSYFAIGLLYSIRSMTENVLEIPSGVYADAFGRRRALIISFCAYLVSFVGFAFAEDFGGCAVAMGLFGLGEAFRSGTHKAIILAYLEQEGRLDERVSYYGRTRAASQLGSALNALLAAGVVLATAHYRYLFLAATVPYVLGLVNLLGYPRRLDAHLDADARVSLRERIQATIRDLAVALKDRGVVRTVVNVASFTAAFKASKDYLQPVLETIALSFVVLSTAEDQTAVIIGVTYFGVHLLSSAASRSASAVGARLGGMAVSLNRLYLIGAVIMIAGGTAYHGSLAFAGAAALLIVYVVQNLRKPIGVAALSEQVQSRVTASALSAESQISALLQAIFAPVLGVVADRAGIGPALVVLGIAMLVIAPFARCRARVRD